ncbi:MAG: methylmalonyl-CoA mutase family protein [Pseudomonadota bacterium]|nr:methylmalonyl-CoA mutase family protein [Pseudomonadota bacterium]
MAHAAQLVQTSSQASWQGPLRFITSTSLYDGHDAAINVIRRLLLEAGAEVIHLGHNRSVEEIVCAAVQEDADGIAVSSYQGGHMEFFRYLIDDLKHEHAAGVQVFVGGGGTITQNEARKLESEGITRVYTAEDGLILGLQELIQDVMEKTRSRIQHRVVDLHPALQDHRAIARTLSCIEQQLPEAQAIPDSLHWAPTASCPLVGITGTGGAGKSSLIDELLSRLFRHFSDLTVACLTVDPTHHRTGGAMLGDRIRLNNAAQSNLFLRSIATRRRHLVTSATLAQCAAYLKTLGFGLVLVETAGTGQGDSEITELADISVYVMTSDYGAPSQLEKIEMLAYADLVALNKADRQGAVDALADVRRQWCLDHKGRHVSEQQAPVIATRASRFDDAGTDQLFARLCEHLADFAGGTSSRWTVRQPRLTARAEPTTPIPAARRQYLAEAADQGRKFNMAIISQAQAAAEAQAYYLSLRALADPLLPEPLHPYTGTLDSGETDPSLRRLRQLYMESIGTLSEEAVALLRGWPALRELYRQQHYRYRIREQEYRGDNYAETLSHSRIPRIALPHSEDWGELLRFLMKENLPGYYPFTAGVFPYRRSSEDPARMFAGEGIAERTNRRFHFLARGQRAIRLSTAFDPVALYGEDPDTSPDAYGRIGMSGVSVATLDDFKRLYSGFDLRQPRTSVSMTINGPGPIALACFINTALDQQVEKWLRNSGQWPAAERQIRKLYRDSPRPGYRDELPAGHDGLGLGLLGVSGQDVVDAETYRRIRSDTLTRLRGTLQADILKEDQAQNECLFAIEFALRLMADVQAFISKHGMRHYYSVSISGYHIAEAGANPITQLAFTLANGLTLVEVFLAHGMNIDDFAPHLSFFFSNGLEAEYAVIGRVARRIWARAMRERYHANSRSQRLKYHIQTSGRSLHTREIGLNDIRTTLQALYAISDNCNSLHTNAADEAVTTPTEASSRRALAIQMIINREFGLGANENVLQGAFIIDELTDLVEDAVYREFERLSERGGVLSAMETLYQRRRIQEQSLYYEQCKNDGSLPVVGVNTFVAEDDLLQSADKTALIRPTDKEKQLQIKDVAAFKQQHAGQTAKALASLQAVAASQGNVLAELLDTVRVATLGQITHALYAVGGRYRRNL